jgi:hypothetical protein
MMMDLLHLRQRTGATMEARLGLLNHLIGNMRNLASIICDGFLMKHRNKKPSVIQCLLIARTLPTRPIIRHRFETIRHITRRTIFTRKPPHGTILMMEDTMKTIARCSPQ